MIMLLWYDLANNLSLFKFANLIKSLDSKLHITV